MSHCSHRYYSVRSLFFSDMNHQVQYVVGLALCAMGRYCARGPYTDSLSAFSLYPTILPVHVV